MGVWVTTEHSHHHSDEEGVSAAEKVQTRRQKVGKRGHHGDQEASLQWRN